MKRNQIYVTAFLLFIIAFTALMTFYVGPRMMAVREEVARDQHFYKCQAVVSGEEIEVQLRGWERPNPHPVFPVRLAGVDAPPPRSADDPELAAWAEVHDLDPVFAADMGEAAHRTLVAFIRKQNLVLHTDGGVRAGTELEPETPVHVVVSGTPVNRKLLESGLAFFDPDTAGDAAELYRGAEQAAKAGERGLWRRNLPTEDDIQ